MTGIITKDLEMFGTILKLKSYWVVQKKPLKLELKPALQFYKLRFSRRIRITKLLVFSINGGENMDESLHQIYNWYLNNKHVLHSGPVSTPPSSSTSWENI